MSAKSVTLRVEGISCASCVATIEGAVGNIPGVTKASVNLAAGKLQVAYDPGRVGIKERKKAGCVGFKFPYMLCREGGSHCCDTVCKTVAMKRQQIEIPLGNNNISAFIYRLFCLVKPVKCFSFFEYG